jgi:hypothetical protein
VSLSLANVGKGGGSLNGVGASPGERSYAPHWTQDKRCRGVPVHKTQKIEMTTGLKSRLIPESWTVGDVARALGVPPTMVQKWIYRGHLAALLKPRQEGKWRTYSHDEVAVVAGVRCLARHMDAGIAAQAMEKVLEHFAKEWFAGVEQCAREQVHLWVFVSADPFNATMYGGNDVSTMLELLLTAPGKTALYDVGPAIRETFLKLVSE